MPRIRRLTKNAASQYSPRHIRALVDGHDTFGDSFGRGDDAPDAMLDAWSDDDARAAAFAMTRDLYLRRAPLNILPKFWWKAEGVERDYCAPNAAAELRQLQSLDHEWTREEREHFQLLNIDIDARAARVKRSN